MQIFKKLFLVCVILSLCTSCTEFAMLMSGSSIAISQNAYSKAYSGADMLTSFLPLILIFVVFYFLLIRPQQKKQKEHKAMLAAVRRGDKIVTAGGLIGTVAKVIGDDELSVEIAEGVKVKVARGMVSTVLSKTEPAKGDDKDEDEKEAEETKKD